MIERNRKFFDILFTLLDSVFVFLRDMKDRRDFGDWASDYIVVGIVDWIFLSKCFVKFKCEFSVGILMGRSEKYDC
jgi:hypothetical protein